MDESSFNAFVTIIGNLDVKVNLHCSGFGQQRAQMPNRNYCRGLRGERKAPAKTMKEVQWGVKENNGK